MKLKEACRHSQLFEGKPVTKPDVKHCAQVGKTLAHIHQIGFSYEKVLDNVMGQSWWESKAPEIYPFVDQKTRDLIQVEIEFQASLNNNNLPKGVIHADMFRDNVLFDGEIVGGELTFISLVMTFWFMISLSRSMIGVERKIMRWMLTPQSL